MPLNDKGKLNRVIDIAPLLDKGRWTVYQRFLTAVTALAVIFDGFDIQILGMSIPSLMKEWSLARSSFAPIAALGLAGMAVGGIIAGYTGDRFGRRPSLIGCVTLFGLATVATSFVASLGAFAVLRFVTGVGAGGALPNAGALAAEIAPLRWRAVAVKLTIVCVPLGGMLGGLIAARVLPALGWRALYQIGGILPLAFAAIMFAVLPESPRFLARRSHLWPKLETLLQKMSRGVPAGAHFEDNTERIVPQRVSVHELLGTVYRRDTLGLWLGFLFCLANIYLVFSWLPAMLTSRGLDVATASQWLALYNFGGVLGVLIWAALMTSFGSRVPLIWAALAAAGSALGILFVPLQSPTGRELMLAGIFISGLLANAVQTSMYAVAAHVYPTGVRASGVAYAASVGRIGGLISSLFGAGLIALGAGAFWGAIALCMVIVFVGLALVRHHFPAVATPSADDMLGR